MNGQSISVSRVIGRFIREFDAKLIVSYFKSPKSYLAARQRSATCCFNDKKKPLELEWEILSHPVISPERSPITIFFGRCNMVQKISTSKTMKKSKIELLNGLHQKTGNSPEVGSNSCPKSKKKLQLQRAENTINTQNTLIEEFMYIITAINA